MNTIEHFKSFAPQSKTKKASGQNAVIYTRVSHFSQEDNTSLESQKAECERYAIRKGYNVVAYFGGTYESAKTDDRKEFNKMIQYVKKSKNVAYIIVYSYERFSRSGISGAKIVQDLMVEQGIMTLAASQDLDPTTAAGQLQQNMLFIFGKMDNDMRRDKTTTGMREVIRKGFFPFAPPIGYTNLNKGRAVDQQLVVNAQGELLRKAFLWKANEQMENATIVRKLRDLGLKTNEKTLGYVLSNPFYCGIIVSRLLPDEVIEGNHEPLIAREIFLKVNNIITDNRHHPVSHKEEDEQLPLKRFMHCGKCNTPMTGYLVRKKGLYYYKCRVTGCGTNMSAKKSHEQFKVLLSAFEVEEETVELTVEALTDLFEIALEDQIESQRLIKAKATEVNQRIEAVEERFAIGEIDKELYTKFVSKYQSEREHLQKELANTAFDSSNLDRSLKSMIEMCRKPLLAWESGSIDEKMRMQNLFFPEGISYDAQNRAVRTRRINSVFVLIPDLKRLLAETKMGEPISSDQFSHLVIPLGFEPRAHTLKVYCSTS